MENKWDAIIFQSGAIFLSAVCAAALAFLFNYLLQKQLLREQNRNALLDLLLKSIETQCTFYAGHWKTAGASAPPAQTFQITEFYFLLDLTNQQYGIKNFSELKEKFKKFYRLTTHDDGAGKPKTDAEDRPRKIHTAANNIRVALWKNKA